MDDYRRCELALIGLRQEIKRECKRVYTETEAFLPDIQPIYDLFNEYTELRKDIKIALAKQALDNSKGDENQ